MAEDDQQNTPTTPPAASSPTRSSSPLVPALSIAAHPMPHRVGQRALLDSLARNQPVAVFRNEPDFVGTHAQHKLPQPLLAPSLSRTAMVVLTETHRGGIRLDPGECKYVSLDGEPLRAPREVSRRDLEAGVTLELSESVVLVLHLVDPTAASPGDTLGMVGNSVGLQRVRRRIEQVADLNATVLIRGETGTGKELVARAIHDRSSRKKANFVAVNLGGIARELAPAELFGAVRGAHSTAVKDRKGFFREADGGTLFLDEIGEAPPEVQVALLRALAAGEILPVGADTPVKVNVRVIAATDAPLEQLCASGSFKEPLLFRLEEFVIHLPPLRQRREDIGPLVYYFARMWLKDIGEQHRLEPVSMSGEPWLPATLASKLVRSDWPGNIRQLSYMIKQMVIASRGLPRLEVDSHLAEKLSSRSTQVEPSEKPGMKISDYTKEEICEALDENAGNILRTAKQLAVPRPSLQDWLRKHPDVPAAGNLSKEELIRCFQEHHGDREAMARHLKISSHLLARRLREAGLLESKG